MSTPYWQLVCDVAGSGIVPIRIELQNGFTVQGRIDVEDAKKIFREPNDLAPITGSALDGDIVVVLPKSKVKSVAFPFWPVAQAN